MIASELSDLASRLSLGPTHRFGRLAVVPLIDWTAKPSGWLTLDAALARGEVEVTEVSESGSVPELCLLNRSSLPIFLLDGEDLVGAKQNRILNLSILVPAASNFEVPVSCVEQGRWSWRSRGFQSAGRVIYSKLRRSNAEAVSQSLFATGSRRGDQGGDDEECFHVFPYCVIACGFHSQRSTFGLCACRRLRQSGRRLCATRQPDYPLL